MTWTSTVVLVVGVSMLGFGAWGMGYAKGLRDGVRSIEPDFCFLPPGGEYLDMAKPDDVAKMETRAIHEALEFMSRSILTAHDVRGVLNAELGKRNP